MSLLYSKDTMHCKKMVSDFPVPSRDVTNLFTVWESFYIGDSKTKNIVILTTLLFTLRHTDIKTLTKLNEHWSRVVLSSAVENFHIILSYFLSRSNYTIM
jgi:hypothetical protein